MAIKYHKESFYCSYPDYRDDYFSNVYLIQVLQSHIWFHHTCYICWPILECMCGFTACCPNHIAFVWRSLGCHHTPCSCYAVVSMCSSQVILRNARNGSTRHRYMAQHTLDSLILLMLSMYTNLSLIENPYH